MNSVLNYLVSIMLIFTIVSMNVGCCSEFSDLSNEFENSSQVSSTIKATGKPQAKLEQASVSPEKNTFPDTDCQGAGECLRCPTGCCHLLIPTLSNLVSTSVDSEIFEEARSLIYISRILSGPKEPPKA